MRIPSKDVPQADKLSEIVRAIEAVAIGARKDTDIAKAFNKDPRQGRYYRRAGEILGFVENHRNNAQLTDRGREFIDLPQRRSDLLADAVLKSRAIQRTLPFLEAHREKGVRRQELKQFLDEVTETEGKTMIPRRITSVIGWLSGIGMLEKNGDRYYLRGSLPKGVEFVEYKAPDEPLFPKRYDLDEYNGVAESVRSAKGMLTVLIDDAAKERAEKAHKDLTHLVASKIRAAGAIPKKNPIIDLAAQIKDGRYIFEMKSTTAGNIHSQVRRAISQLYEYRYLYLQEVESAKLVVVLENPLPQEKQWLVDYVVKDRHLLIAWDGDGKTLHCPAGISKELSFLT
jgi:hypothetical protein